MSFWLKIFTIMILLLLQGLNGEVKLKTQLFDQVTALMKLLSATTLREGVAVDNGRAYALEVLSIESNSSAAELRANITHAQSVVRQLEVLFETCNTALCADKLALQSALDYVDELTDNTSLSGLAALLELMSDAQTTFDVIDKNIGQVFDGGDAATNAVLNRAKFVTLVESIDPQKFTSIQPIRQPASSKFSELHLLFKDALSGFAKFDFSALNSAIQFISVSLNSTSRIPTLEEAIQNVANSKLSSDADYDTKLAKFRKVYESMLQLEKDVGPDIAKYPKIPQIQETLTSALELMSLKLTFALLEEYFSKAPVYAALGRFLLLAPTPDLLSQSLRPRFEFYKDLLNVIPDFAALKNAPDDEKQTSLDDYSRFMANVDLKNSKSPINLKKAFDEVVNEFALKRPPTVDSGQAKKLVEGNDMKSFGAGDVQKLKEFAEKARGAAEIVDKIAKRVQQLKLRPASPFLRIAPELWKTFRSLRVMLGRVGAVNGFEPAEYAGEFVVLARQLSELDGPEEDMRQLRNVLLRDLNDFNWYIRNIDSYRDRPTAKKPTKADYDKIAAILGCTVFAIVVATIGIGETVLHFRNRSNSK